MGIKKRQHLVMLSRCAGEGTRTHTHEAPDPKSGLATNYNTPAKKMMSDHWPDIYMGEKPGLLLVHETQMLYIDSLLHGDTLLLGRLREGLAGTELTDGAGLLELPLELLECSLDVFAFFDGNYNHAFITSFLFADCKGSTNYLSSKIFVNFSIPLVATSLI